MMAICTALSLAAPRHSALTYLRCSLVNPIGLSVMGLTVVLGATTIGLFGIVVAVTTLAIAFSVASRLAAVRREIDRHLEYRAQQDRDEKRQNLLGPTGALREAQYRELRCIIRGIEESNPSEAARFELQDLLDEFARLAVIHAQYERALAYAGRKPDEKTALERQPRVREIISLRLRHRAECQRQIERLTESLEAIDQLVRLVAERVVCPTLIDELDGEIDERLWELEQIDAAFEQLSA